MDGYTICPPQKLKPLLRVSAKVPGAPRCGADSDRQLFRNSHLLIRLGVLLFDDGAKARRMAVRRRPDTVDRVISLPASPNA